MLCSFHLSRSLRLLDVEFPIKWLRANIKPVFNLGKLGHRHSSTRGAARGTDMAVNCGDRLADALTTALPQEKFERSRSQMLQLPVFHPLSAVMRLEPCQFFEYDADSQQYKSSFMGVQSEATAYLTTIHAQGTLLHLVDSGSSVFTSPHKDTLILPITTKLKLIPGSLLSSFGTGGVICNRPV